MRLILLLALVLLAGSAVSGRRFGRRRGRGKNLEVTCSQVKPQEVCTGEANLVGFKVSDGCNLCTCTSNADRLSCTIKSCPREEELQEPRQKRKMARFKRRMERRAAAASSGAVSPGPGGGQRWPIKCFKERKLCRKQPGVSFFDGCNQCRCPEVAATTAECQTVNTCPEFVGNKRQFKRHCRSLGARIEGGRRGNRRRGGGRRQNSLMQWLAQRF